jgi:hypothetical protein
MTQDYKHPITPPPELVQQWASEWMQQQSLNRDNFMATRASQYGSPLGQRPGAGGVL